MTRDLERSRIKTHEMAIYLPSIRQLLSRLRFMPLRSGIFGSSRAWAHASRFSHTPASAALCLSLSLRAIASS